MSNPRPLEEHSAPPSNVEGQTIGLLRVLLVDDHALIRTEIKHLLYSHQDIHVVGEATDGQEAVEQVYRLVPNIVVMDVNMPRMNGIEATRLIKERFPKISVIGLSVNRSNEVTRLMEKAGSYTVLEKRTRLMNFRQLYGNPSRIKWEWVKTSFRSVSGGYLQTI